MFSELPPNQEKPLGPPRWCRVPLPLSQPECTVPETLPQAVDVTPRLWLLPEPGLE